MGRIKGVQNKYIGLGNPKLKTIKEPTAKPKRIYRILVQERKSEKCDTETMRSFMIHDYKGMSTIDSIKKKLQKVIK